MALRWLTSLVREADGSYETNPRPAASYDEAMHRAAKTLEGHAPSALVDAGGKILSVSAPKYMPHVLLDLTASGVSDGDLEELVLKVPMLSVIFEAGRIVGHREAAERED